MSNSSKDVKTMGVTTPRYRAPEVFLKIKYNQTMDVWAAGCIWAELLTGAPLFDATDDQQFIENMMKIVGSKQFLEWEEGGNNPLV